MAPLEAILSKPLAHAGPPTAGGLGPCPDGFWISPRLESEGLHNLPGNFCQCSVTPTLKKKCLLRFRGNLLCFTTCPLPLVLQMNALLCNKCFVSTDKVYHSFYLLFNLYDKNGYSNIFILPYILAASSDCYQHTEQTVTSPYDTVKSPQLVIKVLLVHKPVQTYITMALNF